jgi:hypothetical protein
MALDTECSYTECQKKPFKLGVILHSAITLDAIMLNAVQLITLGA